MPIATSILHLTSAFNDENYFISGRTLEKMGLNDMSATEIIAKIS